MTPSSSCFRDTGDDNQTNSKSPQSEGRRWGEGRHTPLKAPQQGRRTHSGLMGSSSSLLPYCSITLLHQGIHTLLPAGLRSNQGLNWDWVCTTGGFWTVTRGKGWRVTEWTTDLCRAATQPLWAVLKLKSNALLLSTTYSFCKWLTTLLQPFYSSSMVLNNTFFKGLSWFWVLCRKPVDILC